MKFAGKHLHPWNKCTIAFLVLALTWSSGMARAQIMSAMTAFHDFSGSHPGVHVVYKEQDGVIGDMYYLNSTGRWYWGMVQWGAGYDVGQLVGYSDGFQNHVFGIWPGPEGYPHIVEWSGETVPTNDNFTDLTASANFSTAYRQTAQGTVISCGYADRICLSNPSTITGYWDTNVSHLFYAASDRMIHEFYFYNNQWWEHALGGVPSSAENGSGLTSVFDGSVHHVFYSGLYDQHIHELYYYNHNWWPNDWTAWGRTEITPAESPLASVYDGQSATTSVNTVGASGHMLTFNRHVPGFATYSTAYPNFGSGPILTYDVSSLDCPIQEPVCTPTSQVELVYLGSDGILYEVNGGTATPIEPSFFGTLCSLEIPPTGYRYVNPNSPLAGFYDGTLRHIYYLWGGDVIELTSYPGGGWAINDITCIANGAPAA